jgi:hypothetical protein
VPDEHIRRCGYGLWSHPSGGVGSSRDEKRCPPLRFLTAKGRADRHTHAPSALRRRSMSTPAPWARAVKPKSMWQVPALSEGGQGDPLLAFPFLFPEAAAPEDCVACGRQLHPASALGDQCATCGFVVVALKSKAAKAAPSQPRAPVEAKAAAWSPKTAPAPAVALASAVDFGELPPLGAAESAVRCVACSPARRCAAHAPRAMPPPPPRASKARRVVPPLGAPLLDRSNRQSRETLAYDAQVDPACREAVLAAAARSGAPSWVPSAETQRALMGGDKVRAAPRLDTAWSTEANDPRSRVRCMLAAGWTPVEGTFGSHPRWERTLQAGLLKGTRQVINFSGACQHYGYRGFACALTQAPYSLRCGRLLLNLLLGPAERGPAAHGPRRVRRALMTHVWKRYTTTHAPVTLNEAPKTDGTMLMSWRGCHVSAALTVAFPPHSVAFRVVRVAAPESVTRRPCADVAAARARA